MGSIIVETCQRVCSQAKHVKINAAAIESAAQKMPQEEVLRIASLATYDTDLHYVDIGSAEGRARTVQYLLIVDALNFCFWPTSGLEYEHLSKGLKAAMLKDPHVLDAHHLIDMTAERLRELIGHTLPQEEERVRLVREIGQGLLEGYQGSAAQLVRAAGGSAVKLVQLVTAAFPGFRDHAVYQGRQVFFYKRAQIFVGDVHGALQGQHLGEFHDMHLITMFADYRVPVVLKVMGILQYTPELDQKVTNHVELPAGGEEEVEIRAATICAVEQLRASLQKRLQPDAPPLLSVTLDWWLWGEGERNIQQHPPHHRTLTVFY